MVRKVCVSIKGIAPYLQHRNPATKEDRDRMSKAVKILQKDMTNVEAITDEVEISVYKDEEGTLFIPAKHIEAALVKGGVSERVAGRQRKTYKDYMNAFVVVEPRKIPITPQKYQVDRQWVKIQRSRIMRSRPRFDEGWRADFTLAVLDDTIPIPTLETILRYTGNYVGIGDWRPKYGRFAVTRFVVDKE